jgi:hypothetical protein
MLIGTPRHVRFDVDGNVKTLLSGWMLIRMPSHVMFDVDLNAKTRQV